MSMEGSIRKCLVKKWTDSSGYGFNLHAEMGKAGHFIGKVDDGSPAAASGLKEGDRIVEVNDVNIGNENHKQVVSRIKAGGDSVWLLVVDKDADQYCKSNKILISHELAQVQTVECPDTRPIASDEVNIKEDDNSSSSEAKTDQDETQPENDYEKPVDSSPPTNDDAVADDEELPPPPPELTDLDEVVNANSDEPAPPPEPSPEPETIGKQEVELEPEELPSPEPVKVVTETTIEEENKSDEPSKPEPAPAAVSQNGNADQPPLTPSVDTIPKMSAAEMREALAKKKKADPRKEKSISARDKLKMFQNL